MSECQANNVAAGLQVAKSLAQGVDTSEVVRYLNDLLRKNEFKDFTTNGLQVEGCSSIQKIGFAVDSSMATFTALQDCQMIVVHHGLMWPSLSRIAGFDKKRLKFLLEHDINLYVSHLPLDKHPQYGNNAQLLKLLGFEPTADFSDVGWLTELPEPLPRQELQDKIRKLIGDELRVLDFGPEMIRRMAVVSGGGASTQFVEECIARGVDLYLTGEHSLSIYHPALEMGLNVVLAGHYATETFGVRALMPVLEEAFGVETSFFDCKTGL